MTDKLLIVAGIIMFAFVTAVLYVWGLRKSFGQQERMAKILLINCKNKVVKYLKTHDTVTKKQIESLIRGVSAGEFWSRKRITVQNPNKFSEQAIKFMVEQLYIEKVSDDCYRLKI